MIPRVIHYCWFGKGSLSDLALKCIISWRKYFPDYEIKEWNESNYDVNIIKYTSEAYAAKKYAFVSDYARFDILYKHGGVYFDTDVEVIASFEDLLQRGGFMGLEPVSGENVFCNPGLGMAYAPGMRIACEIIELYKSMTFINIDGSYNYSTVVETVTSILKKYGLKNENVIQAFEGFLVYPTDYFCPYSLKTASLQLTGNTLSIHHYVGSWLNDSDKKYKHFREKCIKKFGYRIGAPLALGYILFQYLINGEIKLLLEKIRKRINS